MKNLIEQPDSLIFDMDGTLWDNVNNYVVAWNAALKQLGHTVQVTRESLMGLMGKEARQILKILIPDVPAKEQDLLFDEVIVQYTKLVPTMQSYIYPDVIEGLQQLQTKYKLFLLSNCEEDGLVNFMDYTATTHLFIDYMEHGQNNMPKHHNMTLLKDKHCLKNPVYVGDTEGDSSESALAGLPFVFMTYGFGTTNNYQLQFSTFKELTHYFMSL